MPLNYQTVSKNSLLLNTFNMIYLLRGKIQNHPIQVLEHDLGPVHNLLKRNTTCLDQINATLRSNTNSWERLKY